VACEYIDFGEGMRGWRRLGVDGVDGFGEATIPWALWPRIGLSSVTLLCSLLVFGGDGDSTSMHSLGQCSKILRRWFIRECVKALEL